ncbi:MAG: ATP-binding protein [Patescibacteria group bacterium]|nr:ATP-binding protein [Patescibacteria group bacterium]
MKFKLPFFQKTEEKKKVVSEVDRFKKIKNIIAPPGVIFNISDFQIGDIYAKTIIILTYPKFLFAGWLEKIISLEEIFNLSLFFTPRETGSIIKQLEKQLLRIESQIAERQQRGMTRSPELETGYRDIEMLRDAIIQGTEKILNIGVYLTIFSEKKEELLIKEKKILKILESSLILAKTVVFEQQEALISSLPLGLDELNVNYLMNSSSASSFFPFISSELSMENGILLGINLSDNSLVLFDRFAFENAHMVIFARSGSGKSYTAKLEIMRNLMMGQEVIVLDPENEYQSIAEIYGGSFIPISLKSEHKINPLDLPHVFPNEDPVEIYKEKMADIVGLLEVIIGNRFTAEELTIIDKALAQTYASFNIFPHSDFSKIEIFPTLNDLERVLMSIEGGKDIAEKLYPYTQGNYAGLLNQQTNVDLDKRIVVFGFRDLVDDLRPIGMYMVLNDLMNKVRRERKRRIIILDEAWWIMKNEAGANFLLNAVKRGRKYLLGITTITQDVEDFLNSNYGKPIITNSALVFLMKQSPATINLVGQVFSLSEGEKSFLVQSERGRGILIAGFKRVPIYVLGSYSEDQIIKSTPEQLLAIKKALE